MTNISRPLSYLGVRAPTPSNFKSRTRAPLPTDYDGVIVGDWWHEKGTENLWYLSKKTGGVATWTQISGAGIFDHIIVDPGDITVVHGDIIINEGALKLEAINYPSTLRTLADGTVYGLPDVAAPAVNEGEIYHINDSGVAQWGNLTSAGGTVTITTSINGINLEAIGGVAAGLFTTDDAIGVVPTAGGNLFVAGGDNINTTGAVANTVTVNLNKSISQPATNAAGTEGLYSLNGTDFMHGYGTENTFLGEDAGNRTLTSQNSVGIGTESLRHLTTGDDNTGCGHNSGTEITTGSSNVAIGASALLSLTTGDENVSVGDLSLSGIVAGDNNIALGSQAGSSHTAADSSNIDIGNVGVLGESNTIRIGTQGSGVGQQDTAYIAGVYGVAVSTTQYVKIDANGKLGTDAGGGGGSGNIPVGGIIEYDGVVPANFIQCDGSAIDQATYAALYAAIGHRYVRYDFNTPVLTNVSGSTFYVRYFNALWLVGGADRLAYSSDNGATWAWLYGFSTESMSIYGGLAVMNRYYGAYDIQNGIWSSADGVTWTQRVSNVNFVSAAVGNDGAGNWVAVSRSGYSYYSADGINWIAGPGCADCQYSYNEEVEYGNGVWGIGNIRSVDGINWVAVGGPPYNLERIKFHDGNFYSLSRGLSADFLSWTAHNLSITPYAFDSFIPNLHGSFQWMDDTYAPFWIQGIMSNALLKSYNGFDYEIWSPLQDSPYYYGWTDSNLSYPDISFKSCHNGLNGLMLIYKTNTSPERRHAIYGSSKGGTDLTTHFFLPYEPRRIIRYA